MNREGITLLLNGCSLVWNGGANFLPTATGYFWRETRYGGATMAHLCGKIVSFNHSPL